MRVWRAARGARRAATGFNGGVGGFSRANGKPD